MTFPLLFNALLKKAPPSATDHISLPSTLLRRSMKHVGNPHALPTESIMPLDPNNLSEADRTEIASMMDTFGPAVVAKDWDSLLALYTDDTVIMPPNSPPVVGKSAVRAWAEALPSITAFVGTVDEVAGAGGLAFVRGSYRMVMDIPGVAEPVTDEGSYLEIREKQPDGRWLLARDIFNSDLAAEG